MMVVTNTSFALHGVVSKSSVDSLSLSSRNLRLKQFAPVSFAGYTTNDTYPPYRDINPSPAIEQRLPPPAV